LQPLKERVVTEISIEQVMRSIDVLGRLAFGGQCVAAMAMIAGPLLFVVAVIVPFLVWGDNRGEAVLYWLGGWALAIALGAAGAALAFFCWRWSGDWITEWPGYATAIGIAAIADAVLAYMLTSTPVPIFGSIAMTAGAAFGVGFLIAGHLAGTQVLAETRLQGPRVTRRR
jgi:hypothetical protein